MTTIIKTGVSVLALSLASMAMAQSAPNTSNLNQNGTANIAAVIQNQP